MPEFILDISQDDWEKAGSKFITFNPADPVGKSYYKEVETGVMNWKTEGVSFNLPVTITGPEGDPDIGKTDNMFIGTSSDAIWKLKEICNVLDIELKFVKGADGKEHPSLDSDEISGKKAVGEWQIQLGIKGGDATKGQTKYPKLVALHPANFKPPTIKEIV